MANSSKSNLIILQNKVKQTIKNLSEGKTLERRNLLKLLQDISELNHDFKLETGLEQSDYKVSSLVSNLPGFIYRCANDKNWTMHFISDGCKKITGYNPGDFINNKKVALNDLIHPDYQKVIWQKRQKSLKDKTFFEFEYPIINKNGKLKWVWERANGVYSDKSNVLFLEGFIEDVSEKRAAEESLKLKNIVFESSIAANSIANLDGKIIDANSAFLILWGYKNKSEVLGKSLHQFLKNKKDVAAILAALNKKGKWDGDYIAKRKNKSEFIAYGLATTVVNEVGKIIGYQSSVIDITENRRTEELLKESENRYKSFFNNSPDAIFLADPKNGIIIDANKAALDLLKMPITKVIGMHQSKLHPKRLESYSIKTFSQHKKLKDKKIPFENFLVDSNYQEIPIEVLANKLTLNGKEVIQGVFRNISERKKIEAALKESEHKFKLFFEYSKDAMLLLDGDVFFDCNNAAFELLGYENKSQMLYVNPAKLSPEYQPDGISSYAKAEKIIKQAYKDGFVKFEWLHRKKNGDDFPVEVMLTSIPLEGKQILFTVWRDITERKDYELEIQKSKDRMQLLVEGTPHLFFYVQNNQGIIEYISPSIENITGYSVSKWLNQNNWFITESPINKIAKERTKEHLSGNVNTDPIYVEILHANGSYVTLEIYERPIFFNDKVIGLQGVAHDITQRLQFEKSLKESEESYRGLFNSVSESIYIQDENGVFLDVNEGAALMYGYDKETLIGKTPDFVSAAGKNDLVAVGLMSRKAFLGEKQQFEFWGKRKNGEEFLKDVRLYPGKYFNKKVVIAIATDITEKKKVEQLLLESEERYRAISNLTSDYLFSTKADEKGDHHIVWIAGSFEKITGYTIDEYHKIGGWRATLHPDELELDNLDLEKLRRNEKVNRQIRVYHKNGSLIWVRSSATPVWDKKTNRLIGIYGAVEDVTQSKQTEIIQKIQYNIADAAVTYKTLTELFEIIRSELSAIINVNNFFIALFDEKTGMLKSDVERDEMEEIAEWPANGSMTGYVIEQKKSVLLKKDEITQLIRDGKAGMVGTIPEVWLGVPFKIGGKVFGVLVVQSYDNPNAYDKRSIEILEIVAHELSLFINHKKAEEETLKLSTVVVQSPIAVIITDPGGNIEYVNPKFSEVTGYAFEEVKWKNPRILNSGLQSQEFYSNLWNTILSGKTWQGEFRNKKKTGEVYWENALISPIMDADGKIIHLVAIKEDISEKKKMIEELIKAKEDAEEMNRIKSSFFANMSHELRTPMMGILGFSEVLMQELKDYPDYLKMVNSINTSGQRLLETLNLILNLSKLEASKVNVELKTQNIIPVLKECFEFFESAAAKKNIHYTFISEYPLIVCNIDKLLFTSIFNNLLNNAIKFTDAGNVTLSVSIDSDSAIISVADTGVGISESKQNLIWEEFRQASEGYNRGFEGTGLGLTIAKKYTDLMKGSISAKSSFGKGTTFKVSFPLSANIVNKVNSDQNPEKTAAANSQSSAKILYVEDDEISIKYVKTVTKSLYAIDSASDSDEALNKIKQNKYDAILMDINLRRGMDGLSLTKVIRKIDGYQSIPIVAITAFAMGHEKEEFLAKGMTHYLSKPFVKNQLLKMLADLFDKNT